MRTIQEHCIQDLADSSKGRHRVIPILVADLKNLSKEHVGRRIQQTIQEIHDRVGNREIRSFVHGVSEAVQSVTVFGVGFQHVPMKDGAKDVSVIPDDFSILLMIDEVRTLDEAVDGPATDAVLQFLDGGSDELPIRPDLPDLPNSRDFIDRMGQSRYAS